MLSYKFSLFFLVAYMAVHGQAAFSLDRIVINAGDDYTFHCRFPNNHRDVYWYRIPFVGRQSSQFISHLQPRNDVPIFYYTTFSGPSLECQHIVSMSLDYDIFSLTVFNMTIADSALYTCSSTDFLRRYDIKVVDCPCIVTTEPLLDHGTAPPLSPRKNVTCTLDTYNTLNFAHALTIIRHGNKEINGSVVRNKVTFSMKNAFKKDVTITLNPFINFKGNISCIVPALPTPAPTTRMITTIMSTFTTTPTEKPTSPLSSNHLLTRGDNTISSQDPVSVSTSSHAVNPYHNIPKETGKQKYTSERAILIVLSAVGWSVVLMLVIGMVTIRYHRKRERAPSGSTPDRHETGEEQVEVEETDMSYASIPDTTPPGSAMKILGTERGEVDVSTFPSDGVVGSHLYDFTMDDSRRELTTDPSTAGRHAGQSKHVRQHIPLRC